MSTPAVTASPVPVGSALILKDGRAWRMTFYQSWPALTWAGWWRDEVHSLDVTWPGQGWEPLFEYSSGSAEGD